MDPAVTSREHTAAAEKRLAWIFGALGFLLQMAFNARYGYFRDELYYLACSNHLAFGYVDFAPLVAWLARAFRVVFGDSLHAIRLLPALAFGLEIALSGFITRALGGERSAIFLACISVMLAPVIAGNGTRLAMNPLEPLFWMGCVYVLLLAINRDQPKLLPWCGVLLGFGLLNKHSTIFLTAALVLG
jgi:4-amino-4-deoxy-L-arabinose transferase-like glycosyltransferase